jgi:uncharacterized membrane protein YqjE
MLRNTCAWLLAGLLGLLTVVLALGLLLGLVVLVGLAMNAANRAANGVLPLYVAGLGALGFVAVLVNGVVSAAREWYPFVERWLRWIR